MVHQRYSIDGTNKVIKVSKLADYGVVVMGALADIQAMRGTNAPSVTTSELSVATHLPLPTVAKVLKLLAKAKLVKSVRGAQGGYLMARDVGHISLAEIVIAVDGPVMLTECAEGQGGCIISARCALMGRWGAVNRVVAKALAEVSLAELMQPALSNAAQATHQQQGHA